MIYVNGKNNKTIQGEKNEYLQQTKVKKSHGKLFAMALSLLFFLLLLMFPAQSSKGTLQGINLCIETLLPSLFPFMFVSALFSSSVSTKNSHNKLDSFFQKVLGIDFSCVQSLLLAAFGGYPVGAVTVNNLYKKGVLTEKQSRFMIYIAFGSGMGFLVSYTGANLLSSREAGVLLFSAQLITIFFMVLLSRIFLRPLGKQIKAEKNFTFPEHNEKNHSNIDREEKSLFYLIFQSALTAGKSAFGMCLIVVLFSAVSGIILPLLSYNSFLRDNFLALWEVSAGVKNFANSAPLWFLGFITGFGGICVHLQVYFAAKDISFSKSLFFIFRVMQGFINGCVIYILTMFFPVFENTADVFSSVTEKPLPEDAENPLKFIILILVCFCFLFSLGQKFCEPKHITQLKEKLNFSRR